MLADGKHIAVGVFEPGNFVAVGCGPDSSFFVLDEGILLKRDAPLLKPGNDFLDRANISSLTN
jgi:hypothetical protein